VTTLSSRDQRVHAAAARDPPVELAAERLLAEACGVDEPRDVDAGPNPERLEEAHEILGRDVAREALAVLHSLGMSTDASPGGRLSWPSLR
jgi:hypothetical protein